MTFNEYFNSVASWDYGHLTWADPVPWEGWPYYGSVQAMHAAGPYGTGPNWP